MPDERTCRTCWHWGVIEPGQGLCGHPDTGGAVHGADDTCCNHLAIVGRGGDWQPHEQLSGGSSPAEDWREPMVQMSSSSNPPEEYVGKHLLTGGLKPEDVEPDPQAIMAERDLLKQRVAELEAAVTSIGGALQNAETALAQLEADEDRDDCRMVLHRARCAVEHERKLAATQDRWDRIGEIRMACAHYGPALQEASECLRIQTERVAELEAENERLRAALMPLETSSIASAVQEAAAATMQRDQLQAALELERRAVESLAEHIETACDGFAHGSMSAMEVAPGGYTDAAEIAARARKQALEDAGDAR